MHFLFIIRKKSITIYRDRFKDKFFSYFVIIAINKERSSERNKYILSKINSSDYLGICQSV